MERHYGSVGIPLIECTNPRLGKWRVRWAVQPDIKEETEGVSFVETEFLNKPSMEVISRVILDSGVDASMDEIKSMGDLLVENPFEVMRQMLVARISKYDVSDSVNSFTLGGKQMWLDKSTRVGLMNSIGIEQEAGKAATTLWFNAMRYDIPIPLAVQMLNALELYALECYNVTQGHIAAVMELDSIEELIGYDYTSGYPDRLVFNLN